MVEVSLDLLLIVYGLILCTCSFNTFLWVFQRVGMLLQTTTFTAPNREKSSDVRLGERANHRVFSPRPIEETFDSNLHELNSSNSAIEKFAYSWPFKVPSIKNWSNNAVFKNSTRYIYTP
ncbi:uncharacterized protein LOC143144667 [Ptiloglossa arizonensis]|uniref:uncharacterized protein LOC143144667 n=1 Tax=Ptiloglossa arizonensis TaxID=3350558 RepID=UPI003FA136A1